MVSGKRLLDGGAEKRLFERMLALFKERDLLELGGRQRTDSTASYEFWILNWTSGGIRAKSYGFVLAPKAGRFRMDVIARSPIRAKTKNGL